MKKELQFFGALTVSQDFWAKIKNPTTRMEAAGAGYLGQQFGLEDFDRKILPQITAETPAEFAQQYLALKKEALNK